MSRDGEARERDCDVLVVGCGPVGATVAALLGNAGLETIVIDRELEPYPLPRAVVFDDDALRVWRTVPGLERRLAEGTISGARVSYTGIGRRPFMAGDSSLARTVSGEPMMGLFHQPTLEAELRRTLSRLETVELRLGHSLDSFVQDGDGVTAKIAGPDGGYDVRAGWMLGADGASSSVREALGIGFSGRTSIHKWVVADVFTEDAPGPPEVEFYCDPTRPTVTMPMPGGRRRWEFMLMPGDDEQVIVTPESIGRLIRGDGWERPYEVERAVVYTFHARIADSWGQGRVYLLGDSAHITPPFIGQGMNSGVRDAGNIWWKIAAIEAGAAGPVILDTYELERRDHVKTMVDLAVRLGGVIQTTRRPVAKLRDGVISRAVSLPGISGYTERLGWKPDSVIPRGLLKGGRRRPRSVVGTQIPALTVARVSGERIALDEAIGARWGLLSGGRDPWADLDPATRTMLETADTTAITIGDGWDDPEGEVSGWLDRNASGGTAVIRPDRFVQGVWRDGS